MGTKISLYKAFGILEINPAKAGFFLMYSENKASQILVYLSVNQN